MIALYDLRIRPWTWDFFTWLVIARSAGATGVGFQLNDAASTKWSLDESFKRFWNYLEPGPRELAQMEVTLHGGVGTGFGHNWRDVPDSFERLRLINPKPSFERYTVTLRRTFHRPERNSDPEVWLEFARRIGAHVIDDSKHEPITLRERYSLYANAAMNYGVPNGPVSILFMTPYPVCMFTDPGNPKAVKGWADHGIHVGDRIRWAHDDQHMVWQKPTLDVLLRRHGSLL